MHLFMHHKLEIFVNVEKVVMIVFVKGKEYHYIPFVGKITNIPKLKYNQFSVNYVIGTANINGH